MEHPLEIDHKNARFMKANKSHPLYKTTHTKQTVDDNIVRLETMVKVFDEKMNTVHAFTKTQIPILPDHPLSGDIMDRVSNVTRDHNRHEADYNNSQALLPGAHQTVQGLTTVLKHHQQSLLDTQQHKQTNLSGSLFVDKTIDSNKNTIAIAKTQLNNIVDDIAKMHLQAADAKDNMDDAKSTLHHLTNSLEYKHAQLAVAHVKHAASVDEYKAHKAMVLPAIENIKQMVRNNDYETANISVQHATAKQMVASDKLAEASLHHIIAIVSTKGDFNNIK
jgi:chromosome segregation ATPase